MSRRFACAGVVLVTVLAMGCAPGVSSGGSPATSTDAAATPPGLTQFDEGGLSFRYPAGWREFHHEVTTSFSSVIAYLATVDVPEPCITMSYPDRTEVACADRFTLTPDSLVVTVTNNGFPGFDILTRRPTGATPLTVDGLPAYVETGDAGGPVPPGTTVVTWTLARPGSVDNYFTIHAQIRGPHVAPLRAQLDALVASLRYDPPVVPLPAGATAERAAVAKALGTLAASSATWGCFPATPGASRQQVVASLTSGPDLVSPQLATCTTAVERTPLQLWRLTLALRLPHRDRNALDGETLELWVGPDGSPGLVSSTLIGSGGSSTPVPSAAGH